jgi:MFS family permease
MLMLRAFRIRSFSLLWAGQTISRVGDFLYQVALAWWVLEHTGSAAAMSAVLIASFAPMLLFLLLGGVMVDRYPRVPVMLVSDVARGAAVLTVGGLALAGRLALWHVYAASLLFGLVDAFFQPAVTAFVPEVVPPDDLPSANSLSSLSVQLGRVIGPGLGGAIIGLVGIAGAFMLNGASFLVSAAFLAPLLFLSKRPALAAAEPGAEAGPPRSSLVGDLREGLGTVAGSPVLWISIAVFALTNVTLAGPYSVSMPFLVKDNLHKDVDTLGWLYAMFPIGYVLGVLWMGRLRRIRRRGLVMNLGLALAAVMLGLFGLPQVPLAVLMAAAVVNGAALEAGNLAWVNLLQEKVPADKLGRVSSIDLLGSYVLIPVGFAVGGWATDQFGAPLVFLMGGGITACVALLALLQPAIRRLD